MTAKLIVTKRRGKEYLENTFTKKFVCIAERINDNR